MMGRQRIGEISAKDIWAFVLKCVGVVLFPILLLMPVIVAWRIFFYESEDFWGVVWGFALYIFVVVDSVLLCSAKTIIECDEENLYIIKKWFFGFELEKNRICFKDIKQIMFAEVDKENAKWRETLKKVFRLKLVYGCIYKIGSLLINKGKMLVCIMYGEQGTVYKITDIKKGDERYLYLQGLKERLDKE